MELQRNWKKAMNDIIRKFFKRDFENKISENLMEYNYQFPQQEILDYIHIINQQPISEILLAVIERNKNFEITSADLLQFSSFEDCTVNICALFLNENNPGLTAEETGRLLLANQSKKKLLAYRKYGENHAKAAVSLGLAYVITNVYFISSLGMVYNQLSEETQRNLTTRLVLRTPEISLLYQKYSESRNVNAREFMSALSDSTYRRRRSNLRTLIGVLAKCEEFDFSEFIDGIVIE